ncbi:MAG: sugar ABC transporter permease [Spirochaetaceae bacterium]|nr:sugar ABC transporter permease [Spirochaetaceae bacterium]
MNSFINKNIRALVSIISFWNFILTFTSVVIAMAVVMNPSLSQMVKIIALLVLSGVAIVSSIAGIKMLGNKKNSRFWALAVNYIVFLICAIGTIQRLGFFLIINDLAKTFPQGFFTLIILIISFIIKGWIKSAFFRNSENRIYNIVSNSVIGAIAILFIVQIELLQIFFRILLNLNNSITIGLFLGTILLGIISIVLNSSPFQKYYVTSGRHSEAIAGYLFLTPNLLGFLIFFAGPLLLSFFMSFFHWDVLSPDPPQFIGLGNYLNIFTLSAASLSSQSQPLNQVMDAAIFSELSRFSLFGKWFVIGAKDNLFWIALGNTIRFALMSVPLSVAFALILSNILNSDIPGMKLFRVLFFIPSIAAIVGVALIWKWLYNGIVGFINYGLSQVVDFLNIFLIHDIVWENINWLSNPNIALFAIAIMAVWQTVGFNTVLFLAGLQNIPKSLYEASTIDGAGPVRKFFKITIPMLAPTTFFVVATTSIQALQLFEQVYIATSNPEYINNATLTVVFYLYQSGFENFRQGYASATAWVLFLLIFIVTFFQYRRQKSADDIY